MTISRRQMLQGALATAAGAAMGAAGCIQREADPPGITTLDFYTYATPEFITLFEQMLVPQFHERFPNIRIRTNSSMGDAGYDAKLLTLVAGDLSPDLFHVTQVNFPLYAARDMLLPLDDLIAQDKDLHTSDFYPQLVDGLSFGGKLFGLPSDFSTVVMLYNQDLFDRYGVPYPSPDWTWDEFLDAAKKLTHDTDGDGYTNVYGVTNPDAYNRWPAWVWMNGGEIFSRDHTRCTMDDPASIEGLRFYCDLSVKHKVAPTPAQSMAQEMDEQFASQRVAMVANSRYPYKKFLKGKGLPFRWDVANMPRGPKTRATTFIYGGNCILKSSRHPKEAWEFLKFMSGPVGAQVNLKAGNAIPAFRKAAEDAIFHRTDPRAPKNDRIFLDAVSYGRVAYCPPQYADYDAAMAALHDAFLGYRSVEDCCREMTANVNTVLSGKVF